MQTITQRKSLSRRFPSGSTPGLVESTSLALFTLNAHSVCYNVARLINYEVNPIFTEFAMLRHIRNSVLISKLVPAILAAICFCGSGCGPTKAELDAKARKQLEIIDEQMSRSKPRAMTEQEIDRVLNQIESWKKTLTPEERRIFESNDEEAISRWLDKNPQKDLSLRRAMQP